MKLLPPLLFGALACALLACPAKSVPEAAETPVKLPIFGVTMKIPESFKPVPQEGQGFETPEASNLQVDPFTVVPQYVYSDSSGKGILVVSELTFTSPDGAAGGYPMSNLYTYQENLEAFFGVEEITSEEFGGREITTILMGMAFNDEGEEISLFKGLCFKYPDRYFMIDLYIITSKITVEDAQAYQNMFYSLSIL
jgi:hypothetical protein